MMRKQHKILLNVPTSNRHLRFRKFNMIKIDIFESLIFEMFLL